MPNKLSFCLEKEKIMEKCQDLSVIMISALRENCPAQASLTVSGQKGK